MIEEIKITGDCIEIKKDFTKKGKSEFAGTWESDSAGFELLFEVPALIYRRFFGKILTIQINLKEKIITYRKNRKERILEEIVFSYSDIIDAELRRHLRRRFFKKTIRAYSLIVRTTHENLTWLPLISGLPAERYEEIISSILKAFAVPVEVKDVL